MIQNHDIVSYRMVLNHDILSIDMIFKYYITCKCIILYIIILYETTMYHNMINKTFFSNTADGQIYSYCEVAFYPCKKTYILIAHKELRAVKDKLTSLTEI